MTTARKARVGSISSGTLRTYDLLASFADELSYQGNLSAPEAADVAAVETARGEHEDGADFWGSEEATWLLEALEEHLQERSPPYCYFGTCEGDGADFGYWPCMEEIEELTRVSDPSEVENHLGEPTFFVNDHGNVTVYGADGTVQLEIV